MTRCQASTADTWVLHEKYGLDSNLRTSELCYIQFALDKKQSPSPHHLQILKKCYSYLTAAKPFSGFASKSVI